MYGRIVFFTIYRKIQGLMAESFEIQRDGRLTAVKERVAMTSFNVDILNKVL